MTMHVHRFNVVEPPTGVTPTAIAPKATQPAKIPAGTLVWSVLTGRPIPRSEIPNAISMVAEQNRIGHMRDPREVTSAETTTRAPQISKTNKQILEQTESKLEPLVDNVRTALQERNTWALEIERLANDPVQGPHGETLTLSEATTKHNELSTTVQTDTENAITKHRRFDPRMRRLLKRLVWLDIPLFTYFLAGALNISVLTFWETPGGNIRMMFAVILAIFGTVAVALGLSALGTSHRSSKNDHEGWAMHQEAKRHMTLELGLAAGIVIGIAALMSFRAGSDVLHSGNGLALALVVGFVLGLASALLNYAVYLAEFRDGSTTTEQLDKVAVGIDNIRRAQQGMSGKVNILDEEIEKLIAKGYRVGETIRAAAHAKTQASKSDRAIRYARSVHQGAGHADLLPEAELDYAPLETALRHLSRDRTHHKQIEGADNDVEIQSQAVLGGGGDRCQPRHHAGRPPETSAAAVH
jgi:chaperonin cofactor prefoldin